MWMPPAVDGKPATESPLVRQSVAGHPGYSAVPTAGECSAPPSQRPVRYRARAPRTDAPGLANQRNASSLTVRSIPAALRLLAMIWQAVTQSVHPVTTFNLIASRLPCASV